MRVGLSVPLPAYTIDPAFMGATAEQLGFESIWYAEHPAVAAEFVRALPGADGPNAMAVNAYSMVFLSRIAGLVQAAQERGEVAADISPFQAASNIFSLYFGALLVWLSGFGDLASALDPGLRNALELQMSGLRRRDSR